MPTINRRAVRQLAESSVEELKEVSKRWKETRITKLVRFSSTSHQSVKRLAKERKLTMSRTLDHIINKFFEHQNLYELD